MTLDTHEERRRHPRFSVKLPIDYWEAEDTIHGGLVANISEKGLLIYSVHEIRIGTQLRIRVYLSIDDRLDCIEGIVKIMWANLLIEQGWAGYRYGAYIMQMPPHYHNRLMKYILMLTQEDSSFNREKPSDRL